MSSGIFTFMIYGYFLVRVPVLFFSLGDDSTGRDSEENSARLFRNVCRNNNTGKLKDLENLLPGTSLDSR